MKEFESIRRLDYLVPEEKSDPAFHFDTVLPGDRGHMFGVMECIDPQSEETIWLRAFSSLGTGVREIPGWVSYLVTEAQFSKIVLPVQQEIKRLTAARNELSTADPARKVIEEQRRELSRALMPKIHDLYFLKNFKGEEQALRNVYPSKKIPGGVGDCCAPKLIQSAIEKQLVPISCAEFFWGGSNASGKKQPAQFFPACEDKCQPILGYMLCGLSQKTSDLQKRD